MIVLTREQTINVLGRSRPGAALLGRRLTDGRFAFSDAISGHPDHAAIQTIIAAGSVETPTASAYVADGADVAGFRVLLDGKDARLATSGAPYAISKPSADVWRFEIRNNDYGDPVNDPKNGNRRSEVVTDNAKVAYGAVEVWAAWTTILGPRTGALTSASYLTQQWHSVDAGVSARSPVLSVNYGNGTVDIVTRSDAELTQGSTNGVTKTRYTTAIPAAGALTRFVLRAKFGQAGHLQAWINGTQVYDADIPLGYYNDAAVGKALAYPHWGIYGPNRNQTDVIYHANPEHGTGSLLARVATPLAVTVPAGGWV